MSDIRKLATIRRVKDITPIPGADNIELATVGGWKCVVLKNDFHINDLALYCEVDSFMPVNDKRFEFLSKGSSAKKMVDGSEGYRLKTKRLRGQLSQGLLMPLSKFPEITSDLIVEGTDVTDLLKIKLYEAPIPAQLSGSVKGMFPSFLKKTDAERIQNLVSYFDTLKDIEFEETEKLNGASMTVYVKDGDFGVCSRNLDLLEDYNNSLWRVVKELGLKDTLLNLKTNIALQGELIGEGIAKNPYKVKGQVFSVFSIWDPNTMQYMTPDLRFQFLDAIKATLPVIMHVPVVNERIKIFEQYKTIDELLKHVEGQSLLNENTLREGSVFKSWQLVNNEILIFKVLNNEHLLKE